MFEMVFNDNVKNRTVFQRHKNLWAFVVFACLSAYALGANPFSAQTVAPLDLLIANPGWSTVQSDVQVVHSESSDIIDSQLPSWISLKEQIWSGRGALWWPYGSGGQPIYSELLNPTFMLFLVIKDNALAYYLVGLAKLIISGFGCYLLLRTFLRWLPSLWGGVVFMLCGFNAAWFFWDQVATAMWIPWLLWATLMYLKTENSKWLPSITIASLLLIFGAFPAVGAFGFYSFGLLVLIWNIWDFAGDRQRNVLTDTQTPKLFLKKTALPFLAVGIAFLMSAITLIPFIDSMAGIDLSYRAGDGKIYGGSTLFGAGTSFKGVPDLLLFLFSDNPSQIERTAYIGIPVVLFALVGIFSAFRAHDTNLKRFTFFNINQWGRLVVVTLLGLAVLSSIGIDFLISQLPLLFGRYLRITPLHAHRILVVFVLVILALQFHYQKKLFNSFNAVVPSSWLYPLTPSINYVKEHLQPLQSVIADDSFHMSGTLGAYGIAQWFAHSFRTEKEKDILSDLVHDPFPSPTSSLIHRQNIHFDSPFMEKLVIKYLMVDKDVLEPIILRSLHEISPPLPELSHSQAPPLPDNSWRQHIKIPNDIAVRAIGFLFATNGQAHAPANIRLTLYSNNDDKYSIEPEIDRNAIVDNQWVFFEFPDKVHLKKGVYSLLLSLVNYTGPDRVTAWATKIWENKGNYLEINGFKTDTSLKITMGVYEKGDLSIFAKKWNVLHLEKDVVIFENKQVTNSAYFIKDLDAAHDQIDFTGLDVKQPSAELINVIYTKADAGWIVLPMHLHAGWKAYVNNRQVMYDNYLSILPAIPVSGASQVTFRYEPHSFKTGAILSLAGFIIFALFTLFCVKYGSRRKPA
jgi:hypothetical protein